jgi:hypothetical protein
MEKLAKKEKMDNMKLHPKRLARAHTQKQTLFPKRLIMIDII